MLLAMLLRALIKAASHNRCGMLTSCLQLLWSGFDGRLNFSRVHDLAMLWQVSLCVNHLHAISASFETGLGACLCNRVLTYLDA